MPHPRLASEYADLGDWTGRIFHNAVALQHIFRLPVA
jgi:hypothetical protein